MSVEELAQGKWNLEKSENFDDYMKAIGVGMATRLIGNKLKPSQEISVSDGNWSIKTVSTFKSSELKFKIGEEFDETTPDGRAVKTTVVADGTTLTATQSGDIPTTMSRQFTKDTFTMILKAKDVICTRVYKKAE